MNISALFVTFTAVGIWHGPTLNFFVFGLTQAAGVVAAQVSSQLRTAYLPDGFKYPRVASAVAWSFCFHYICGSFLFLDNSVDKVGSFFHALFTWLSHGS